MVKPIRGSWIDIISNLIGMAMLAILIAFVLMAITSHLFSIKHSDLIGRWQIVERHGGPFYGCNIIEFGARLSFTDESLVYSWVDDNHIKVGEPSVHVSVYEVGTPLSGGGIILKDSQGGTIKLQKASSDTKYDPMCFPPG